MKIAVCDDHENCIAQVRDLILEWADRPADLVVHFFDNGDDLLQSHAANGYDLILLDVVMPLFSGMETARELRQTDRDVKLVFLTSSPEFAVEAFEVKASNYLLKPLCPERFFRCLSELTQEVRSAGRSIAVREAGAVHRVGLNTIEYIEAQNKHTLLVLSDGRTIRSTEPLYTLEDLLPPEYGFFKCNRSFLVNLFMIDTYSAKEIKTRSGARIPISRGIHREFEGAYFSAIFGKAGDTL